MSESSPNPADSGEPFDAEEFARNTVRSVEFGDAIAGVLEDRVTRLEEIVAARWPRSLLLRWRLAHEIRATVATWPDDYIPRDDFRGRRWEWAAQAASARYHRTAWKPRFGADEQAAEDAQQDGADPGAGFLP